jgi:hypothetical protein
MNPEMAAPRTVCGGEGRGENQLRGTQIVAQADLAAQINAEHEAAA